MRTQQEMIEWFANQPNKKIAKKSVTVIARPAVDGEIIETILANGHKETENTATANDMVVTNKGGEQYLMSKEKFDDRYEPTEKEFCYQAKGQISYVGIEQDTTFIAPWGKEITILAGGVICSPYPEGEKKEVYGIAGDEFKETYETIS